MIIGINEGINSSVVAFDKNRVVFAIQEERLNRVKNFTGFPVQALNFTLDYLNLAPEDVSAVVLSNLHSPMTTRKEFLQSYDDLADISPQSLLSTKTRELMVTAFHLLPESIQSSTKKSFGKRHQNELIDELKSIGFAKKQIVRYPHHQLHAASAYYGLRKNPDEAHLVLTLDGGGDGLCSQMFIGEKGKLTPIAETKSGNSVGNIYSWVTHLMGMTPHEHEYKLMGLSAYRKRDKYVEPLIQKFESYLGVEPSNPLTFGRKIKEPTYAIQLRLAQDFKRARFDNLAAALQFFTEDLLCRWVSAAVQKTGIRKVLCAGGVFMNIKANKKIAELPCLDFFDVFPSCGDETLPFGGVWQHCANIDPEQSKNIIFDSFCLGPEPSYDLNEAKTHYGDKVCFSEENNINATTARLLAEGEIVARVSGPMEFGARALGNRSLLADPGNLEVVPEINDMIKGRDFWMPFAPAMLPECASEYIEIPPCISENRKSPFMMHSFETTEKRKLFVAGTHRYDKTARAQIVTEKSNPGFNSLLQKFREVANKGVLLNTSFNLHGYPIVMGAVDAIEVMLNSSLKYMVVNNTLIRKV